MAWSEIIIILLIAVILIKPQDIPKIFLCYNKLINKIAEFRREINNIVNVISHNQEILELEQLLRSKSELKERDIELINKFMNNKMNSRSNSVMPDIIEDIDKKTTIH